MKNAELTIQQREIEINEIASIADTSSATTRSGKEGPSNIRIKTKVNAKQSKDKLIIILI